MTWRAITTRPCRVAAGASLAANFVPFGWKVFLNQAVLGPIVVGRCKLKPVQPVLKVPGFSTTNLHARRRISKLCLQFQLAPLHGGEHVLRVEYDVAKADGRVPAQGKAVQVDPGLTPA